MKIFPKYGKLDHFDLSYQEVNFILRAIFWPKMMINWYCYQFIFFFFETFLFECLIKLNQICFNYKSHPSINEPLQHVQNQKFIASKSIKVIKTGDWSRCNLIYSNSFELKIVWSMVLLANRMEILQSFSSKSTNTKNRKSKRLAKAFNIRSDIEFESNRLSIKIHNSIFYANFIAFQSDWIVCA